MSVRFEAVSAAGTLLGDLPLVAGDPDAAADEYVGTVNLTLEKFRIYARVVDANGFPFARAFPTLFGVQTVRVRPVADGVQLPLGQTTAVAFEVTNLGPSSTFAVTAADDAGFVSGVVPSTLTLGPGALGRVTVNLSVPSASPLSFDTLTVVARITLNPAVSNSARIGMSVGVRDQDGDGIPDDRDRCVNSDTSPTIVIGGFDSGVRNALLGEGCYMLDFIQRSPNAARNHGDFVSDVALLTNDWVRSGLLKGGDKGAIQSSAGRARIP